MDLGKIYTEFRDTEGVYHHTEGCFEKRRSKGKGKGRRETIDKIKGRRMTQEGGRDSKRGEMGERKEKGGGRNLRKENRKVNKETEAQEQE